MPAQKKRAASVTTGSEYDFEDGWCHDIRVMELRPLRAGEDDTGALSLGGARACPPELCGGVTGHVDLVDVLRSPNHSRHAEVSRWLEATRARYSRDDPRLKRPYDPGAFDLEAANIAIRKLTNSGQET